MQLVNFAKNYSLETKSIYLNKGKKFSRDELIDAIITKSENLET